MENKVTFRNAERKDTGVILQFVKELAAYEDMSDDVIADESILETWIFDKLVMPEYRGKGYGKALLKKLASIAVERGCGRFEWVCLDWNKPSIDFYLSLGAEPQADWTIYRMSGDTLTKFAE